MRNHRSSFFFITLWLSLGASLPAFAADYTTSTFLSNDDAGTNGPAADAYVDEPRGFDAANGEIYLVDTINNRVEKIGTDGILTNVAGAGDYGYRDGSSDYALFAQPQDIAIYGDTASELFIADTNNNVIRKIKDGEVSTLLSGLSSPQGVAVDGDTVFISDTGNNRILGIDHNGGATVEFGKNLDQPTKLLYWPEARSLIFVNAGEGTVRAINLNTGELSDPLISDLEDIGGIFLNKRNLFVVSSYSIGVFNEIWKLRLDSPDPSGAVTTVNTTQLSHERENEHLNWPSDVFIQNDTLTWEEYYSWNENVLYETASVTAKKNSKPECVPFRKQGQPKWRSRWFERLDPNQTIYSQNYLLKPEYQGDQMYFRLKVEYDNKKLNAKKRTNQRDHNQSNWKNSEIFADGNLSSSNRAARHATLNWQPTLDAEYYKVQLWKNDERLTTFRHVAATEKAIPKRFLLSNSAYKFRVKSCTDATCSDWTDFKTFRTLPAKIKRLGKIVPTHGVRMEALPNGQFLTTLQFRLYNAKASQQRHLRAKIELCAKDSTHPDTVTANRIYVLYKGGSAILAWQEDGKLPDLIAGKHRFQDEFGDVSTALLGRPKDIVFNSDQSKLYIAENNKLAVYDFTTQQLSELAGHVMDSYTEGLGNDARFSDPSAIALSPDNAWLYVVDRNNHRIRKVNAGTGETSYITGAGGTNFSFSSEDSNGYQEGGPCADEFDQGVAGCAYFNRPTGITVSPDGKTLYVAEGSNNRIRSINIATGQTALIAGSGASGFVNGTGSSAQFNGPYTLDITSDGKTLYVADKYNHAIRKIDLATKAVTTVIGKGTMGNKDGSFSVTALAIPEYIEEDNGVLYWTEAGTQTVRAAVLASQQVFTVSGSGERGYADGLGANAQWNGPKGIGFRGGKMYVADSTNDVIRSIQF